MRWTSYRLALLNALLLAVSAGAAQSPEDSFRESAGLSDYASVTYQAEDGTVISADEFLRIHGRGFSIMKQRSDDGTRRAIVRVVPPDESAGVATPSLSIRVGQPMPDAALPDVRGVVRNLRGSGHRPLLVSYFFAECAPCIQEIPELNAFAQANKTIDVVAVTFDAVADAKALVAKHGLTWPVVAGAQAYIDQVGVKAYPTIVLVAPDGKLLGIRTSAAKLDKWVRRTCYSGSFQSSSSSCWSRAGQP